MWILSLFFVPALTLIYFAGTQHSHAWSFALLGGASLFLYGLIAQFYKLALDQPEGTFGLSVSQVNAALLWRFMTEAEVVDDLVNETSVFVATNESGIVEAHDLFMARFNGQKVFVIGSDLKKRSDYGVEGQ